MKPKPIPGRASASPRRQAYLKRKPPAAGASSSAPRQPPDLPPPTHARRPSGSAGRG
ncbi:MAG: hypothetical protein R3F11_21165 [Verrucomicrobiales bacterium]